MPDPDGPEPDAPSADGSSTNGSGRGPAHDLDAVVAAESHAIAEAEATAERDVDELARADAERMLAGPGLVTSAVRPSPEELEAEWASTARATVQSLRDDYSGRRVGLAISGGGSLGSFEAGALRFLYDHARIAPVAVCGNSAGALNAAKLAEGDLPDRTAVDEIERIWRSLRLNSDMWEPEPWLARLQASASWAVELREHVTEADGAAGAVKMAVRVVSRLVRRPPETDGTIDAIRDALRAQSLLSLVPVADLVERELDPERVAASGIALRMGTVSLESGELRYVTETGALHDRQDQPLDLPPVDIAQGVLASASIPVAFPPVLLGDENYVDGGAREILPLELMVHHLGVERVVAISASSLGIARADSFTDKNLLDILRRVSAEIAPNETLRKELNPPGGWQPGVCLIVPDFDVHDSMTIDPALIAISIDHGWMRSADVLLELDEEARRLTSEITKARMGLRRIAGPLPTLFGGTRQAPTGDEDPAAPSTTATPATTTPATVAVAVTTIDPDDPDDPVVLTADLRRLVDARRQLGAPLPPSLLGWLAES